MSRIEQPEIVEWRRAIAEGLSVMGWPMFDDDEGNMMLRVDGFFDAVIVATIRTIKPTDAEEGDDG